MNKILALLAIIILPLSLPAQLDSKKEKAIDSLFAKWNSPNHPGGAVGISQNGRLVYSKAFGLASLEYLVPNNPGTQFNIASVSKQFTAMAIVRLSLEGKLSIDDDIRKYIPEIPDFGFTITFRHMLHHTSGLRSLHMILGIAGWRGDDYRNNDDLLRIMTKQRDLNFIPGSEYMYCNTGFILMAVAVERITGKKFPAWMKENIFLPLGMYNTYVEDRYNRVVSNNATSYNGSASQGFAREVEYWGYTGSGNIHSTTVDLLTWFRSYYRSPDGWHDAFSLMLTLDPFNDGKPNNYAFGVVVDTFRNERRISHSGSIGGFRAFGCTFPERETEIVLLSNFSSSDISENSNRIANILLDKPLPPVSKFEMKERDPVSDVSDKYAGAYIFSNIPDRLFEIFKQGKILYYKFTGSSGIRLYEADDTTLFNNPRQVKLTFNPADPSEIRLLQGTILSRGKKIVKYVPSDKELAEIAGNYWSPELETQYSFSIKNNRLTGYQTRHGEFTTECIAKDTFVSGSGFIDKIIIARDRRGKITGMKVSNSRVRDLWMERR